MAATLGQQLKDAGLGHLAKQILAGVKPSIRLTAGKPSAQPVSRLGGRPNLPKGVAWPEWNGGQPLAFIAQVDLAALPALSELKLPKTGSLYFFFDTEAETWGFDPKDKGSAQVIYHPTPLADHRPRAWHPDLDEEMGRFRGVALSAAKEDSLPGINALDGMAKKDALAYLEWKESRRGPLHRVGGNPDEIQNGVHAQAHLVSHGYFCGDERGYNKARKDKFDASGKDWRLLLQVDSEDGARMAFGDMGRLYFMIHKDDLARRAFENVWTILQCT